MGRLGRDSPDPREYVERGETNKSSLLHLQAGCFEKQIYGWISTELILLLNAFPKLCIAPPAQS
jgi:hypothetical protein